LKRSVFWDTLPCWNLVDVLDVNVTYIFRYKERAKEETSVTKTRLTVSPEDRVDMLWMPQWTLCGYNRKIELFITSIVGISCPQDRDISTHPRNSTRELRGKYTDRPRWQTFKDFRCSFLVN
jgi:hypothetical protein